MQFLRRISTRHLLTLVAAVLVAGGAITAIAIAATSGGPTPPPKPLADAVHDALTAPQVDGVSARIHFTNRLIDQSSLGEGSDPLLGGADGRLWATNDGRLRIELQAPNGGAGDSQILVDNGHFTIYDSGQRMVYTGDLPQHKRQTGQGTEQPPTLADVQQSITKLMQHAGVSGAEPSDVAGRAAYTVRVSPKQHGGMVGAAELAWDAANGVPLRAAVYATGSSDPVLELEATGISFGKVDSSVFAITPPSDAKVVDLAPKSGADTGSGSNDHAKPIEGVSAVQAQLPFTLAAPDTLAGRPRSTVRLVASDKHPAALVTYGQGLDGIAVIETQAGKSDTTASSAGGDHRQGLSLPSVKIGGATGNELATALGTALTFERGGVRYVVLGSVPPSVAEAAANAL